MSVVELSVERVRIDAARFRHNEPAIIESNVVSVHFARCLQMNPYLVSALYVVSTAIALIIAFLALRAIRAHRSAQTFYQTQVGEQAALLAHVVGAYPPIPIVFTGLLLHNRVRIHDTLALLLLMTARGQINWHTERTLLGIRHILTLANGQYFHPLERVLAMEIAHLGKHEGCHVSKLLTTLHSRHHAWEQLVRLSAQADGALTSGMSLLPTRLRVTLKILPLWGLLNLCFTFALFWFAPAPTLPTVPSAVAYVGFGFTLAFFLCLVQAAIEKHRMIPLTQKGQHWQAYLLALRERFLTMPPAEISENGKDEGTPVKQMEMAWRFALQAPLPEDVEARIQNLLRHVHLRQLFSSYHHRQLHTRT